MFERAAPAAVTELSFADVELAAADMQAQVAEAVFALETLFRLVRADPGAPACGDEEFDGDDDGLDGGDVEAGDEVSAEEREYDAGAVPRRLFMHLDWHDEDPEAPFELPLTWSRVGLTQAAETHESDGAHLASPTVKPRQFVETGYGIWTAASPSAASTVSRTPGGATSVATAHGDSEPDDSDAGDDSLPISVEERSLEPEECIIEERKAVPISHVELIHVPEPADQETPTSAFKERFSEERSAAAPNSLEDRCHEPEFALNGRPPERVLAQPISLEDRSHEPEFALNGRPPERVLEPPNSIVERIHEPIAVPQKSPRTRLREITGGVLSPMRLAELTAVVKRQAIREDDFFPFSEAQGLSPEEAMALALHLDSLKPQGGFE